jgi:PAT family beta-lactamase induction signal transducer AmpG
LQQWLKSAATYQDPRILCTLFLGFSSGLPFLLTLATLHAWLTECGVNKTTIGLFALVTIPYSFKFIWAPFVDHFQVPGLCSFFGKRKGWMLASQLLLVISLVILGATHPQQNILLTAAAAFLVALSSASQDIVIEAFRVESLEPHLMGPGASASSLGYRLGMLVSGAGALYLAEHFSWFTVYIFMAGFVSIGILATLLSPEPQAPKVHHIKNTNAPFWHHIRQQFRLSFKTMLQRKDIKTILLFIFCYKIGDTILNTMTMPFLLETGFSKIEIANVAKLFGITAMITGGLIGGLYLSHGSLAKALVITSLLQIFASLMFWLQASLGHNLGMLFVTIGVENFASGLGSAAFIVFLSSRCRMPHTATHFALLTSCGSFCRVTLSSLAGWTADHLLWTDFYLLTAMVCLPCLLLVLIKPLSFEFDHGTPVASVEEEAA